MSKNCLEICSLVSSDSLSDFLLHFNSSKARQKKYFEKKLLKKAVMKGDRINLDIDFLNDGIINPKYIGEEIKFIDKSDLVLVFDKPKKIHSYPHSYSEHDNVLSFFRSLNIPIDHNLKNNDRGLLYRLDYETSGLMIYVCDEVLLQELRDQFSTLVKEKIYQVVVSGKYDGPSTLVHFIKGSGPKNSKMIEARNGDIEAVRAELKICESDYDSNLDVTKLKVQLLSGHRHQIRVQLSLMNHPIVGDPVYGGRNFKRMLLHAFSYSIKHPKLSKSWTSNMNLFNELT